MKITPEDMEAIRNVWFDPGWPFKVRGLEERDIALASILCDIWDRGYDQGHEDAAEQVLYNYGQCPHTHAHTREWCGYAGCRES